MEKDMAALHGANKGPAACTSAIMHLLLSNPCLLLYWKPLAELLLNLQSHAA